jgi:hypothetical protein
MIMPGPAGMHPGSRQGIVMEVAVAAGKLPINTVGAPGGMIASGNPGCGSGVGAGAGGWIGAWQCGMAWMTMSVMRAAGGLMEIIIDSVAEPVQRVPNTADCLMGA